jgi:Hypervirulence associated proteins TUDOR domain
MAEKSLKRGDKVEWDSSGGHSVGEVVGKTTDRSKIKGHQVAASAKEPQYIVKSGKSGKIAAHKASSLKRGRS